MTSSNIGNRISFIGATALLASGILIGTTVTILTLEARREAKHASDEGLTHLAGIVKNTKSALVTIFSQNEIPANLALPQLPKLSASRGTGFIVSGDGYIITNRHVVQGLNKILVSLGNHQVQEAMLVGADDSADLALLKIKANESLPFAHLGNSSIMEAGDWVVALGNPFGLEHTVTAGIISAKGRVIGSGQYDGLLQTDAAIHPGNSGGPLLNLHGEVVGVNAAVGGSAGIGFAVPIENVKAMLSRYKISVDD